MFRELRASGPIVKSRLGYWLVLGHDECRVLLGDERTGAITELSQRPDVNAGKYPTLEAFNRAWVLFADRPQHSVVRRALTTCSAARIRHSIESVVEPLATTLAGSIDWNESVELVSAFARPFPLRILGDILGLPPEHLAMLSRSTMALSEVIEPFLGEQRLRRAEDAARELCDYFRARTWEGAEGCVRDLLGSDSPLEHDAAIANVAFLATSGHETTANLISAGALLLLTERAVLETLCDDSSRTPALVEELLRLTSPIQLVARRVNQNFAYAGYEFFVGDILLLFLAAANRDPRVFAEPDLLRLDRESNAHVAFGAGDHLCFGAALTRAEARAAFSALAPALTKMAVDEKSVVWQRKRTVRGLERLILQPA